MARPSRSEFNARTQKMVGSLRDAIVQGSLQTGDYLPSEVELGRTFGLSKESVRRALDILVEEGLIAKIRRVGNRVKGPFPPHEVYEGPVSRTGEGTNKGGALNPAASLYRDEGQREDRNTPELSIQTGETVLCLAYHPSLQEEVKLQEAVQAYEGLHPDVRVRMIPTPFPLDLAEHGMADVVTVTAWDALKLKEKNSSMSLFADAPLTDYAHPILSRPFQAEDGRLTTAPFVYSPLVLCYNRSHFAECGIAEPGEDWTWYTLLKTARTFNKQLDARGFVVHIQSINRWPVFLLQNGFRFNTGKGKRAAEDPALWESLRISRDLIYQQGDSVLWTDSDGDVERWFHDGRASMILTTFFGLNRLRNNNRLDYGVAPLPSLSSKDTLLLTTGLAVNRRSASQEAAGSLIRYLCGQEVQSGIRRGTLTLPVHPGALTLPVEQLEGNRPHGEARVTGQWDRYRLYSDLHLSTHVLEAVSEELKVYWSRLEDEAEASERIEVLLGV
ncbi:extracellular solute-binding protein [Paenibacillus sp. FJAT-26967]|uniref:extracellular solute-binding protein n=1 Tax=Paenibacillus sp. FJAT-26967 TaxID=1729690 RepID=UPI000A03824C|nr:extracellular solute-binding protein [Paenibacillus sp. FJAT-26967]